jgi:hypothetical protein
MNKFFNSIPWFLLITACLTLGLAPFNPPHFWEKILLLSEGNLKQPVDWFDFLLHGIPWFLTAGKVFLSLSQLKRKSSV